MLLVTIANAIFWGLTFVCALGLLRRREWGRKGVMAVFATGAIASAAIGVAQQTLMNDMCIRAPGAPADAPAMFLAMRVFSAVFALLFVALFAWLAIRLNSAQVRAEFSRS